MALPLLFDYQSCFAEVSYPKIWTN